LELSRSTWLITSLSPGNGEKMSKHTVVTGDMAGLLARFSELKRKTMARTGKSYPIIVIQEAGLDGFWIHRALQGEGIESHVVVGGATSQSRPRRPRGTGDGRAMPAHLKAQISRELDRLELLLAQIKAIEVERDALLATADKATSVEVAALQPVAMLLALRGIGPDFTSVLWSEGLNRHFSNRRQIASYAGLAPTPWRSGAIVHEQGVSKAGNPRLRTTMIELAWLWVHHQPQSALTLWYRQQSKRGRKTTIVALARKLLVALWKYVTAGVVIEGAVMKAAT
jgi:transposase